MRAGDGLVFSSLQSLIKVQGQVSTLQLAKRKALARHLGQHHSVFKGRGMDFAESRPYQPGDDIRTIDWRVTARSGRVHTKVFQEEREKPVLLWIDMRTPMYFATRGRFKSVVAAEVASLLLWKTLDDGDRAGGILQRPDKAVEFKPMRSRQSVLGFLRAIADASQAQLANLTYHESGNLKDNWQRLRRVVEPGSQVYIISDFRQANAAALQQLVMIHRVAAVTLIAINDPLEEHLPEQGQLRMTDERRSLWVNLKQKLWRDQYHERYQSNRLALQTLARQHRMPLVLLSTRDNSTERLRKLSRGTQ